MPILADFVKLICYKFYINFFDLVAITVSSMSSAAKSISYVLDGLVAWGKNLVTTGNSPFEYIQVHTYIHNVFKNKCTYVPLYCT
jgi:hypothetical protein